MSYRALKSPSNDPDNIELYELNYRKRSGMPADNSYESLNPMEESIESFIDLSPTEPVAEESQFTLRAVIVGCLLGTLISASNFYVGLRLGWTFGAGLFGAIFGFSIIKFLAQHGFGGSFSAKEHATLSSVATAAGSGTLAGYISGIPAMYRLGLLTDVDKDMGKIALWSIAASLYGIFFAIPLRKWFILKQKLPFPSPTATAEIIKSLHTSQGALNASKKTRALLWMFLFSLVYLIFAWFIPILKTWRIFWWLSMLFDKNSSAFTNLVDADEWNFYISVSWAFIGAGMMTPLNTSISTNLGSVLAWGIIGPILIKYGIAPGDRHQMKGTMVDGKLIGVTEMPTARYWLLWPGLAMMICSSFTELACKSPMLLTGLKSAVSGLFTSSESASEPDSEQIPLKWWLPGLLSSITLSILVLSYGFGVNVGQSLLAIALGFFFAFVGLQSAGETDLNPTGTIAKASQIVFSALPPVNPTGSALDAKRITNLAAGLVSASAASQSVDMVSDLKTGHLIGASPKSQFQGQFVGSLVGSLFGLFFWKLFSSAYPCIISTAQSADTDCQKAGFGLQAVTAWQGITIALTKNNSIPESSFNTALAFGIITIVATVFKARYPQYSRYFVSMNSFGIAFVNTDPSLFISMLIGSIISNYWKSRDFEHYEMYMYAVASGLIAGEGVFGLVQAAFSILQIKEGLVSKWGTR